MTLDELKTLLALNGGRRLPHLEGEIFSCEELYTVYIHSISSVHDWYVAQGRWVHSPVIGLIVEYSTRDKNMQNCGWPEAEHLVAMYAKWSYFYAKFTLHRRFYKGEKAISKDRYYITEYNKRFGTTI